MGEVSSSKSLLKSSTWVVTTSPNVINGWVVAIARKCFLRVEQKATPGQVSLLVSIVPLAKTKTIQPPFLNDSFSKT